MDCYYFHRIKFNLLILEIMPADFVPTIPFHLNNSANLTEFPILQSREAISSSSSFSISWLWLIPCFLILAKIFFAPIAKHPKLLDLKDQA